MAHARSHTLNADTIACIGEAYFSYTQVRGDDQLSEAFHEAGEQLPRVERALQLILSEFPHDTAVIGEEIVQACYAKARLCRESFAETAQTPGGRRFAVYSAVVRQNGDSNTVEALVMGMMRDLHALVDEAAVQPGIREQVHELHDEIIDRLSVLESSVPNTQSRRVYNNYGRGAQFNVSGSIHNTNSGGGNQFPGATFNQPLYFGRRD